MSFIYITNWTYISRLHMVLTNKWQFDSWFGLKIILGKYNRICQGQRWLNKNENDSSKANIQLFIFCTFGLCASLKWNTLCTTLSALWKEEIKQMLAFWVKQLSQMLRITFYFKTNNWNGLRRNFHSWQKTKSVCNDYMWSTKYGLLVINHALDGTRCR